jgi:glycosyltransferase involved in cell wall biosynthesis
MRRVVYRVRADQIEVGLFSLAKDRGRAHFLAELEATGVRIHDMQTAPDSTLRIDQGFEDQCLVLPKPLRGDVVALYHLAKRLEPNVLHGWQDRASLACGFVGAHLGVDTTTLSARNMQPSKRDRSAQIDDRPLFTALCAMPNVRLTANSYAGARDYEEWLDLPNQSVPVLNNGLELDRYKNTRVAAPALNSGDAVRITGVFRLAPNKRPMLWLNTVSALQRSGRYKVKPRMVGVGPLRDQVLTHAKSIDLEGFELDGGLVDPADIYGDADVVLLMSRIEGTPNVLLEAQAMGIAAAGCDVGGVSEAVLTQGEGAGLIMPEEITAQAAAQRIEAWLPKAVTDDPAKRTAHIRENFSLESLGSRAIRAYGFTEEGPVT